MNSSYHQDKLNNLLEVYYSEKVDWKEIYKNLMSNNVFVNSLSIAFTLISTVVGIWMVN